MTAGRSASGLEPDVVKQYFESTSSFWKQFYESQGLQPAIYQARRAAALRFLDEIGAPRDARVLDIGCGAGVIAVEVAMRGYCIHAVDSAPAMVEATRRCAAAAGVADRVITSLADVHALQFPDQTFDVIIAIGVVPWVPSLGKPLGELARVLRAGGHLILSADNRRRLSRLVDPLLPARRVVATLLRAMNLRPPLFASRMHTIKQVDSSLRAAGFETLDGMTLGFGPFTLGGFQLLPESAGLRLDRVLEKSAHRVPFLRRAGAQYIVLAKKRDASNASPCVPSL